MFDGVYNIFDIRSNFSLENKNVLNTRIINIYDEESKIPEQIELVKFIRVMPILSDFIHLK